MKKQTEIRIPLRQKLSLLFFGVLLFFVLLELGLRLGAFALSAIQERGNLLAASQKGTYRILCLGESTTVGQYPRFLEEVLNQRNTGIKFSVIDRGVGGITTSLILSQLEYNLDKYRPDLVVTMMGINDLGNHMPRETTLPSNMTFLKSLRVYKLARLLWLHIVTKVNGHASEKAQPYEASGRSYMVQGKYDEAEREFKTAIEIAPDIDKIHFELGIAYRDHRKYAEAEREFKEALRLNPGDDGAYALVGSFYKEQGDFAKAEQAFKKALELNSRNNSARGGLAWLYANYGKMHDAEQIFEMAIETTARKDLSYTQLGKLYANQGRYDEAEQAFKKAIAFNPASGQAYKELGWLYNGRRDFAAAEQAFLKAVEYTPQDDEAHLELGSVYLEQKKSAEAEQEILRAVQLSPRNDRIYAWLLTAYPEINDFAILKEYWRKKNVIPHDYYSPVVVDNYLKFKKIVDGRNLPWVCVQYPIRSIEPLKRIFEGQNGIIFVDNEAIFKNAVRRDGFNAYFRDIFGGDFGHCTDKGNKLLAENIAAVIIKEVFHR